VQKIPLQIQFSYSSGSSAAVCPNATTTLAFFGGGSRSKHTSFIKATFLLEETSSWPTVSAAPDKFSASSALP
jgi:hypothetical protein